MGEHSHNPAGARVLIVDDDAIVAESLRDHLESKGFSAETASSAGEALEALARAESAEAGPYAVAVCDLSMPDMDGLALLREVVKRHPAVAPIMLTGYGTIESAVSALRAGAVDYLTKPLVDAELSMALQRALRQHALARENLRLRHRIEDREALEAIVGTGPRMRRIFDLVDAVSAGRTTVLMSGESGTGKSLIAHAIHRRSARRSKPFVELSCGSIPETLLESELFGHVKGAFTGAHADKTGRFQAADGGTIFLDEINSASPAMQLKLLRVLQERRFEPVGGTQTIEVDARVILASNQPLEDLVARGLFRQDLYYRINVVKIELPPLRERVDDIPLLAGRFLARFAADLNKQVVAFSPEALEALCRYGYPGNVRELQNAVERAVVLCRGQTVRAEDLPPHIASPEGSAGGASPRERAEDEEGGAWTPVSLDQAVRDAERRVLLRALRANGGNRQRTAEQLGINRTTLYKKMKALGLDRPDERAAG